MRGVQSFGFIDGVAGSYFWIKEGIHIFSVDYFLSILPLRSLKEVRTLELELEGS